MARENERTSETSHCLTHIVHRFNAQVVNSTFWASEVGAELAATPGVDLALVWFTNGLGQIEVSLRSARDDVDVVRSPLGARFRFSD